MNEILHNPEEVKTLLPRFKLFYFVLAATFFVFSGRLWFLQVYQGQTLRQFSERNHLKELKVEAPRGLILDREGRALVDNRLGYEVYLQSQYIQDWEATFATVAPLINMPPDKLEQRVTKARRQQGRFAAIKIKENLTIDEVFRLKRARLTVPGLDIRDTTVRNYTLGKNGSQALGYVGEISRTQLPLFRKLYPRINFEQGDIVGKFGIEELLEAELHGHNGVKLTQVDAFGREVNPTGTAQASQETQQLFGSYIKDRAAIPGNNVVLTLDMDIQQAAWDSFIADERIGGVVAMKADGEILSWISSPSFDPNDFLGGISHETWNRLINDPFKPLRNKVIQDHFAPGSTLKPMVALAALQENVIKPNTSVFCPPALPFGNRLFHDHLRGGFGNINLYEALERSSNVYFYKLGISLGVDRMHKYIAPMGIGTKTGIELPREAPGLMPSTEWKRLSRGEDWHPGENLSVAIGQGFTQATPLQLAISYLAIGTEGKVVQPFLIKKVLSPTGELIKETQPKVVRDLSDTSKGEPLINPEHYKPIKEGLRLVVNGPRGTARGRVRLDGVEIAGKTGTAQVRGWAASEIFGKCENRPKHMRHHGWFVGYAPADKPEIVVAALAEHSCSGSGGAGPVVRAIMKKYFEKYHPEMNVSVPVAAYVDRATPSEPEPVEE